MVIYSQWHMSYIRCWVVGTWELQNSRPVICVWWFTCLLTYLLTFICYPSMKFWVWFPVKYNKKYILDKTTLKQELNRQYKLQKTATRLVALLGREMIRRWMPHNASLGKPLQEWVATSAKGRSWIATHLTINSGGSCRVRSSTINYSAKYLWLVWSELWWLMQGSLSICSGSCCQQRIQQPNCW